MQYINSVNAGTFQVWLLPVAEGKVLSVQLFTNGLHVCMYSWEILDYCSTMAKVLLQANYKSPYKLQYCLSKTTKQKGIVRVLL